MEVYNPAEDSQFFSSFLRGYLSKNKRKILFLDVGTGSGILAETALEFLPAKNIFACDINKEAVKEAKRKGINSFYSDLFSNVEGEFDLITFNVPYLPRDSREPKDSAVATTGGKKGDEISIKFLKEAKKHLKEGGRIFLLISSLTPRERIDKFVSKVVAKKKLWMEELIILEFR